jgi:hypothetical protein
VQRLRCSTFLYARAGRSSLNAPATSPHRNNRIQHQLCTRHASRLRSTAWRSVLTKLSSTLQHAQLDGVFVSITPGDPSLWVGVIFVRKGSQMS